MTPDSASSAYEVVSLDDSEAQAAGEGRARFGVRGRLGIQAFGVNAFRAAADVPIVREHRENGLGSSGQEELYVVLDGHAVFDVDGGARRGRDARDGVRAGATRARRGDGRVQRRELRGGARQAADRAREAAR